MNTLRARIHALSWAVVAFVAVELSPCTGRAGEPAASRAIDFNREIKPILAKNCYSCHGQDETHRAKKLRIDRREGAILELADGAVAIVPGEPEDSELIARVTAADETLRMPPAKSGDRLGAQQTELLRLWIQQGAPYAEHWAFVKPKARPLPNVLHRDWSRNGIDRWILARLEAEGLEPSREADKFTLLRRLSLDLRGLPPTIEEIDKFMHDDSTDAYERAVDRFLADPAYGERWARVWLDLARYADSAGYGSDPLRTIWRYRDWVVDAYNRNLPYDQFTIDQLAGDLAANPSLDQRIATAFHRNTMTNSEGGTDDEEFRAAAIKDRVDTTGQVWMGLTFGCAKCHDHKYDPISQREYYQLYAFYNQTEDNDQPDEGPVLAAPDRASSEQIAALDAKLAQLKAKLETPTAELTKAREQWEADLSHAAVWVPLEPSSAAAESGATLEILPDRSVKAAGKRAANDIYSATVSTDLNILSALRIEMIPDQAFPNKGSGRGDDGNFVLSRILVESEPGDARQTPKSGRYVRIELPGKDKILSLAEVQVESGGANIATAGSAGQSSTDFAGEAPRAIDGNTNGDYLAANSTTHTRRSDDPWWELDLKKSQPVDNIRVWNRTDGPVGPRLAGFRVSLLDESRSVVWQTSVADPPSPSRELSLSGKQTLNFSHAAADFSQAGFPVGTVIQPGKINTSSGWAVAPNWGDPHSAVFVLAPPLKSERSTKLTIQLIQKYKEQGYLMGRFRLSATSDPRAATRAQIPEPILAIVDTPPDKRSREQLDTLEKHYRSIAPMLQPIRDQVAAVEKTRPKVPTVPVMVELAADKRRRTHILLKGNHLSPGDEVEPAVPASFPPLASSAPVNRMGLALWITDPNNPLTARVSVNRYWAQLFGSGIVETEEDFGTQGEPPSHPELLDWLALEYIKLGWDTKALLREIVNSSTYRQSSKITPELLKRDPRNKLLARGSRYRLEAEMVRDQALAVSGLLSKKMHGPSVFPPQPDGLWQAAFNGQRTWSTSRGEDQHRRGLYTFWRRTVPYPSMAAFDAPSREICLVRRIRTNTPLQAFVTMNDPTYVEASQALARRIVLEGGSSVEDRIRFGLRISLARPAADEQVKRLASLYASEVEHYRNDPKAAVALATDPIGPLPKGMDPAELAAWTTIANLLLNLDAVLTKG